MNSLWIESAPSPGYPRLEGELEVDVAIIGGGLAGLNCAYQLLGAGKTVAVFEKAELGSGTSGKTTGKVSSQHGKIYQLLQRKHGTTVARLYGEANQEALASVKSLIKREALDCDWADDDNYIYTDLPDDLAALREEAAVAHTLGLPASFEPKPQVPFPAVGAVKFEGQGKLNARKYILGLAAVVAKQGGRIFEHSQAFNIRHGQPCHFRTLGGGRVIARDVIIATKAPAPLVAHGLYCALEYPQQSYIVAGRRPKGVHVDGMYINTSGPLASVLPIRSGGEDWLLVGGQSHIPGFGLGFNPQRYHNLEEFARRYLGLTDITHRWHTMDYLGYDHLPFIGPLYPWTPHVLVATAFHKWGLTNTMVAATILRDRILGEPNKYADTFTSLRLPLNAFK